LATKTRRVLFSAVNKAIDPDSFSPISRSVAIAQIAGCGVLLADQLGFEPQGAAVQVAAL